MTELIEKQFPVTSKITYNRTGDRQYTVQGYSESDFITKTVNILAYDSKGVYSFTADEIKLFKEKKLSLFDKFLNLFK